MSSTVFLALKWTLSRAAETYGYNVVTLTGSRRSFRTVGGGYDMVGSVFAQWLACAYPERLAAIADRAHNVHTPGRSGHERSDVPASVSLYGLTRTAGTSAVHLDGGCGLESMRAIAQAIGVEVQSVYIGRSLGGFNVTTGAAPAKVEGGAA